MNHRGAVAGGLALLLAAALAAGCSTPKRLSHAVTVTETIHLSQHGIPPDQIIAKMNRAGTIYNLSDAHYRQLRELGVTLQVIDYMKSTYVEAVVKHPWLADDDNLDCWYMGYDGVWYGGGPWGFHPDC